jgi:hypothetical protein
MIIDDITTITQPAPVQADCDSSIVTGFAKPVGAILRIKSGLNNCAGKDCSPCLFQVREIY